MMRLTVMVSKRIHYFQLVPIFLREKSTQIKHEIHKLESASFENSSELQKELIEYQLTFLGNQPSSEEEEAVITTASKAEYKIFSAPHSTLYGASITASQETAQQQMLTQPTEKNPGQVVTLTAPAMM